MSEKPPTVEQLFESEQLSEIKTDKFIDFTSQLKICVSSVRKIYLVYGILENVKTLLYGNKAADMFENTQSILYFATV